jgi:prophage regulatory protein
MLRLRDVRTRVPLSASTIKRLVAAGEFPKPVQLSPSTRCYFEDEVDAWLQKRAEARG